MKNPSVFLFATICAIIFLLTACKSPTVIDLFSPTGSTMTVGGKAYPFPSVVSLKQKTKDPHEADGAYDITLMIDDPSSSGGFVSPITPYQVGATSFLDGYRAQRERSATTMDMSSSRISLP